MAVKERPYIYINNENLAEADFMSRNFVIKEIKNRAFINTLGAEALIKYLSTQNVNVKNLRNIHSIARVLEKFDVADIMMPNIHIDVRVVFDEKQIFIPKSHFEYNLVPDVYVVLKLGPNFEYFEIMGYFSPENINFAHQNSQYYFFEDYKLSSPTNLVNFIKTFSKDAPMKLFDDDLEKGRELSVALADHDIENYDLKTLMKLLVNSAELRDAVLEYDNFETLSHRVGALFDNDVIKKEAAEVDLTADLSDEEQQQSADEEQQENAESEAEEVQDSENSEETENVENIENIEEITSLETLDEEPESESDVVQVDVTDDIEQEETELPEESQFSEDNALLEEIASSEEIEAISDAEATEVDEGTETLAQVAATGLEEEITEDDLTLNEIEPLEEIETTIENVEPEADLLESDAFIGAEITTDEEPAAETSFEAAKEIIPDEPETTEKEEENQTIEFDSSFFDSENSEDVVDLTEDFFDTPEEELNPNNENDSSEDDLNIAADTIKNGFEAAAGIAGAAAAGLAANAAAGAIGESAEIASSAALASEEAINLAALAGSEITDSLDELKSVDSFENDVDVPQETIDNTLIQDIAKEDTAFEDNFADNTDSQSDITDTREEDIMPEVGQELDQELLLDEATTNISDLEPINQIETSEPAIPETIEAVNFDDLETTLNLTQDTIQEPEIMTNLEDISTTGVEEPKFENNEQEIEFADFSELNEAVVTPLITDETDNTEILQEMPETTNTIEETIPEQQESPEDAFIDMNTLDTQNDISDMPTETVESDDAADLQSMPVTESNDEIQTGQAVQDFSYNDENLQELPLDDTVLTDDTQNSDELAQEFSFDEQGTQAQEDVFDFGEENETWNDGEPVSDTTEGDTVKNDVPDDFSAENFDNEIDIADEEQVSPAPKQEVFENAAVISDTEFTPGEISIDINNTQQFASDDTQHLESIYNESQNLTNSALNNSARFSRNNSPNKGSSTIFGIIAGILVLVLLGVLGLSALKMFKPATQEEPQPVTDNPFPEMPEPVVTENPNTLNVDVNKVLTMDNKNHAPVAQPVAKTQNQQKIPATSFLEISKLSWEVPDYISANTNFKRYFQSTGKSLKSALSSDLLLANDYIYSKQMRMSVTFDKSGSFKESRMLMSSGSTQIDKIVLQSVNHTLGVLKAPASLGNDQSTTVILKIYF